MEPREPQTRGDGTGGPRKRSRFPVYDVLWKRISQGVGLSLAVVEYVASQLASRPPDPNILLLVSFLIGVPFVAGRTPGGNGDK